MTSGTVERTDGQFTFRYERHLAQPLTTVWQAITDPAKIGRWMGASPEIELRVGGHYITRHRGSDQVVDRILRLEPPRLFEHTFFEYINPNAVVTWQLSPAGTGTLLVLTHVLSTADIEAAASTVAAGNDLLTILSRNGAGWHRLLDLLTAHLNGDPAPWSEHEQQTLQQHYAVLIG